MIVSWLIVSILKKFVWCSCSLEDELVELVWENGQIVMQSQSSRAKKSPTFNNLPSSSLRVKDKFTGNSSTTKIGKFCLMDSMLDNMPLFVPNDEMDLTEEDEVVPWLSYSADDSPQQNYHSPLLPENLCPMMKWITSLRYY